MREFVLSGSGSQSRIDYQAELNDEQRAVVTAPDGPMLVLAGAGSGKTRVITYRVAWLLEHGVRPEQMLLLTFTNKAAREMVGRVQTLLGNQPSGLWAGTFHSIANRVLRQYGEAEGYSANFSILDEEDAQDLLARCVKMQNVVVKGTRFPSPAVLKSIISYGRNARRPIAEVLERKHAHLLMWERDILAVAELYDKEKKVSQAMDFDDLLTVWWQLLADHDDIRQALAQRFTHIFVDEFQDTNIVQAEIVRMLASAHGNVLAVGDDAQSIYSFRAAEIKNMLTFTSTYGKANIYRLVTNYRSTPQILAVANAVIANNEGQFSKELVSAAAEGDLPQLVAANSASQEAQFVAEKIIGLMEEGMRAPEIAVLFRAAFHAQQLEFALMQRGIAYEYRGGMKFFERAHVKDAIAHLRVLTNPKDVIAWTRILRLWPGIGAVTAANAASALSACATIEHALASSPLTNGKGALGWQGACRLLRQLRETTSVASALRSFSSSDEYTRYLEAEYPNAAERIDDLVQLATFAEQFETIESFLEAVTLTGEFGKELEAEAATDESRIILSTIHQAKGLEWDAVFVIHLAEGAFPSSRALDEPGGLEEERRLFYVATTRARRHLFLSYPVTSGFEHVELRQPSQFLTEVPKKAREEVLLRYGPSAYSRTASARNSIWDNDEPTIVLDANGERTARPMPRSFLPNIDDL